MSSLFIADIAFSPINEEGEIPEELRACILDNEGIVDTTLAADLAKSMPTIHRPFDFGYVDMGWTEENYGGDDGADFDDDNLLQVRMTTKGRPLVEWVETLSFAFPDLRVALRGENEERGLTTHFVLVAGQYVHADIEDEENLANLNLRARIACDWEFVGWSGEMLDLSWGDDAGTVHRNVRRVLRDEATSHALLWMMEEYLELTPKQTELLVSHPNYSQSNPDEDYWRDGPENLTAG